MMAWLEHLRALPRRRLAAIATAAAMVAVIACWRSGAFATPPAAAPPAADPNAAPAATDPSAEPAVPADPTKVQVVFATMPPSHATVRWGKTLLGKIKPRQPLVVVRPRDSGPLDVVIRAPGYLPVQTRAHTFSDTKLLVKLTPLDQKSTLLGYRAPLDAGMPIGDGGVPETLSDMPSSLTNPSITPAPGAQPAQPQPQPALPQPQPQQPQPQPQPQQPQPAPPAR